MLLDSAFRSSSVQGMAIYFQVQIVCELDNLHLGILVLTRGHGFWRCCFDLICKLKILFEENEGGGSCRGLQINICSAS